MPTIVLKDQAYVTKLAIDAFVRAGQSREAANKNGELGGAIAMAEGYYIGNDGKAYTNMYAVGDIELADEKWEYSYTCWQIRALRADAGKRTHRDPRRLDDFVPEFSADAMVKVWKEGKNSFSLWSTWSSKAYEAFLLKPVYNPVPEVPSGVHIVGPGDYLGKIAKNNSTTVETLVQLNHILNPNLILLGQRIFLPLFDYPVTSGDTLGGIASKFEVVGGWRKLADLNKIANPDRISVGQVLKIPRKVTV